MQVYEVQAVYDNPLFEGIGLKDYERNGHLTETWPNDWITNYQTWQPKSMKANWPVPEVVGRVRRFNDYPGADMPAFSQRAVDMLRDILEANGELLPVKHELGTYYYFNCTCMTNADLTKSRVEK